MVIVAVVWSRREAPAGLIFVLELAVAGAFVEFGAVRIIGDALHVQGTRSNFEAAGTTKLTLCWSDGLCCCQGGEEGGFEKHCASCLLLLVEWVLDCG